MRALIAGRRQAGETPRSIAGAAGVSPATASKSLRRHESEGTKTGPAGRIACGHGSPHITAQVEALRRTRQPFWKIAREAGPSLGPAARIAKAKGLSRLPALDQTIAIVRYDPL